MESTALKLSSLAPSLTNLGLAMAASLVASAAVYLLYQLFYGVRNIGAGVNRAFLLGGPAITALFLGIQSSIPLSLGLLGALSFVRFRTPVKDAAEIGFLLLLIAVSIGIATGTYTLVVLLFAAALLALTTQRFLGGRAAGRQPMHLVLSVGRDDYPRIEESLVRFLGQRLEQPALQTVSALDDRVSVQYLFRRRAGFDPATLVRDLDAVLAPVRVEIFVGPPG
ncbi:MAG: DUF4956 domain-containing protein [Candidatus Latescibacterota bacterium]|jgi:hypothetical protein